MHTATMPGFTSGNRISTSVRIVPAPSMRADSSRLLGTVSKKDFTSVTASGRAKVVSERIRPG